MLNDIPGEIFLLFIIAGLCIFGAAVVGLIIWAIASLIKAKRSYTKRVGILTAISVVIVIASWFLNFGLIRFAMTLSLIPVIHGIIYIVSNIIFSMYAEKLPRLVKTNILYIITYILPYIFLPDGGNVGEMYFFFGLVHSNFLAYIAYFASLLFALAHIALFILQIVFIVKIKRKEKQEKIPTE
ncbi:MAG: hypothetical protein IKU43_02505 [Clostridia bacterium]|nr:hypothetical protein [Clostridia bacterium]